MTEELMNVLKMMPTVAICMARGTGMVFFLPVLTGHPVNSRLVRSALILVISMPVIEHNWGHFFHAGPTIFSYFALLAKEMFVGVCIGFSAAIPFWAIEIAGFFIDTMRGATMAEIFNVMLKSQTSLFGALFSLAISVLFLSLGGMELLLHALYTSYTILPVMPADFHLTSRLIGLFSLDLHVIFSLAMVFALPAMLIMLIIDIVLGLINVSAKELNVFSLSMPIKSVLAIFLVIISINYSIPLYLKHMNSADGLIYQVIRAMK